MAASLDQTGFRKRSRRSGRTHRAPMSEINVTPFVDVMLVLLVIFMIAAPLLTVGVPIDLPETKATPMQGEKEPLRPMIPKRRSTRSCPSCWPSRKAVTRSGSMCAATRRSITAR